MRPLEARFVQSGAVGLRCTSAGPADGAMVLLLHGFPARWTTWREPMRLLARRGFFVVAPDLRGFGESDKPRGVDAYSVLRAVDDVEAVVRAYGRDHACIAGHDLGGGVAWATAMLRPALVARLATVASVHPVGMQQQMRRWSQLKKSWYVLLFQLPRAPEWFLARRDFAFVRRSLADDGLAADTIDDLLEGVRAPGALHAAIDWYRASFRDVVQKRFAPAKVEMPTLVVWGDRDRYFVPELAEPPRAWVRDARVVHVAEGSHWVQHDAPETTSALLADHFGG